MNSSHCHCRYLEELCPCLVLWVLWVLGQISRHATDLKPMQSILSQQIVCQQIVHQHKQNATTGHSIVELGQLSMLTTQDS